MERRENSEGEPAKKGTASVSRKTRSREAGRGVCLTLLAPGRQVQGVASGVCFSLGKESVKRGPGRAARLPRTSRTCLRCRAPGGPFPDPGFINIVHIERNFRRPFAVLCLPRCPPACLSLQLEPGVRWPRSSPAASETSCAVSAGAQGREADRAWRLGFRGAKLPSQLRIPSSGVGVTYPGMGGAVGAGRRGQLTEVRAPCPCPALLYGDAEKPAESGGSESPRATSRKAACACNQKPCSCPKADVNYAFLHATGKGASRGPQEPLPRPPRPRGTRAGSRTPGVKV